ncbi:hypothetical protein BJ912DRAFT_934062 [Pholiota molesta]|nr:hypothetical protein BJ912DRAFT_934062 [Pholiota molesta]
MAAYGTPDAKRGAINAKIYWDSLNKSSWLEYCKSEDHTFKDTLDFFIRGNPKPYPHLGADWSFPAGSRPHLYLSPGDYTTQKKCRTKASIQECKTTLDKVIAQMTSSMSDFQQQNITVDTIHKHSSLQFDIGPGARHIALQITGESACISATLDNYENGEAVQHIRAILDAMEKSNKNKEQFALLPGVRSLLLAMMSKSALQILHQIVQLMIKTL